MDTTSVLNLVNFSPAQAVQSIDRVLFNIFEAADLPTQKCCREVSSRWRFLVTRQLRKQVTISLCFDTRGRDINPFMLYYLERGMVQTYTASWCYVDPEEPLQVMRNKYSPYDPQPSPFAIPNLIRAIRKNPRGFPCTSIEITTKLLGSKVIKNFLQCVGSTIRRLKLTLYYFYDKYPSFERTRITRDLRTLLLFRTPYLEHFHLIAQLPEKLSSEILNFKLDSAKNFLDEEQSSGSEARRLLRMKSFTYEGLLPRQIVQNIIQASPNLRRVKEMESSEEFLKRVAIRATRPLNPHYKQYLETVTGKIWTFTRIWIDDYFTQNNSNPVCVQLYNEIMESHKETLVVVEFGSSDVCDELRIPAMTNLKTLIFTCSDPEIKLLVNSDLGKDDNDNCESTACQLVSRFPKLELIAFPKEFNFGAHFALRLGVNPTGPFSSIETVQVVRNLCWDVIDTFCTQMAEFFTSAKVCIGENREVLPAFEINNKPPHDPRQ